MGKSGTYYEGRRGNLRVVRTVLRDPTSSLLRGRRPVVVQQPSVSLSAAFIKLEERCEDRQRPYTKFDIVSFIRDAGL